MSGLHRRSPVLSLSGPSSQRDCDQVKTRPEAANQSSGFLLGVGESGVST